MTAMYRLSVSLIVRLGVDWERKLGTESIVSVGTPGLEVSRL